MENEIMKSHPSLQRAIDIAMWMNFTHRIDKKVYGVIKDKKAKWYDVVLTQGRRKSSFVVLPENYADMTYSQIEAIRTIVNPLPHWESLMGMFSTCDGELLRFMLAYHVPLDRIIRYELASRGYDENLLWVGYDKARKIWLK